MGRSGLVFLVLTLAGCSALRDAFSAHPQVAGTAAGQTLTVERLADLAGGAKKVPLRARALIGLATAYLDYAVLAVELARSRRMDDSAFVLAANWPAVAQRRWEHFHDRLVAAHATLSRDQADSAFQAGDVRSFQHILISVPPRAPSNAEREKQQQAERLLREVEAQRGANFAQLARQHSEDPASKARGGYLGAMPRGRFVPAFDSVAWRLAPGAMSGLVRSPFGFHIIRRPPLAEVRDTFRAELEVSMEARVDSGFLDSLTMQHDLKVVSGAPALVRQAIGQPVPATHDNRKLATYHGGALRVRDLARWLLALDARDVGGIGAASDGQLKEFVRRIGQRDLLLGRLDSAGVQLTPDDWREVRSDHDSVLSILRSQLGLSPEVHEDSAITEAARVEVAMAHVNDYLDRVFKQGTAPFFPVPPFLALALREQQEWSINEAGVTRALERAEGIRARVDSAARGGGPGLKPASGPAPVPPDTTTRTRP